MARRQNQYMQEPVPCSAVEHDALTATLAQVFFKAPYACEVQGFNYYNATGLVAHAADNFKGAVTKTGGVVVATLFDTDADDGASLAVGYTSGVLSVVAGAVLLAAGDILTVTYTEEGTATLPAGRLEPVIRRTT